MPSERLIDTKFKKKKKADNFVQDTVDKSSSVFSFCSSSEASSPCTEEMPPRSPGLPMSKFQLINRTHCTFVYKQLITLLHSDI